MHKEEFSYIYGPVESWGIGKSLGIDPLSNKEKICNMDCVYCQLGKTDAPTDKRMNYIPSQTILSEVEKFFLTAGQADPEVIQNIEYITFSGRGEPTLATNLGEMVRLLRKVRKEKIAVITNSSFLYLSAVRDDLAETDLVVAKLDAYDQLSLDAVDKVMPGVEFMSILRGIKEFRRSYRGKLVVRVMFVQENYSFASQFVDMIRDLKADEIQLNTPLRPSAAKPLSVSGIAHLKSYFQGLPVTTVFDQKQKKSNPFDHQQTIKRHGNYKKTYSSF